MARQFYLADTHFSHANIIKFDHRPFNDVGEMEEIMVMNWNAVVRPEDTVYIIGDFCWGTAAEWLRILKRLKGHKVLIKGNHDLKKMTAELKNQFLDIKDYMEIKDNGRDVILSHYPLVFYKHSSDPNVFMLCGHVHKTKENEWLEKWCTELRLKDMEGDVSHYSNKGQIINVGVMMSWIQYCPRTLDEILRHHPVGKK